MIETYKTLLQSRLSDYRCKHSFCVAQAAAELAERYGADPEKAYVAGLLHDITKEADEAEQFELFRLGGVELSEAERRNPKLWHAMSAPIFLKEKLNITDEEILTAIRYHTTARAGMSRMEKILYIADFISADRVYDDVAVVRELAEQGLEKTMLYTLDYTIRDLLKKRRAIHPDSVACYNELILNMSSSSGI